MTNKKTNNEDVSKPLNIIAGIFIFTPVVLTGIIILLTMMNVNINQSEIVEKIFMNLYGLSWMLPLPGLVILIYSKIKYPKNKVTNILLIITGILFVLTIIAIYMFLSALASCAGCTMSGCNACQEQCSQIEPGSPACS